MRYKVHDQVVESTAQTTQPRINENNLSDVKQSKKERTLIIILVLLVIMTMTLAATVFFQLSNLRKTNYKEICQTRSCLETAVRVMDSINKTIEPCDDFFEFACRSWITRNPIPSNDIWWDTLSIVEDDVLKNLRQILNVSDTKDDTRAVKLARIMYRTCMDAGSISKLGIKPLYDTFRKLGLPLIPPSDEEAQKLDVPKIVGLAQRYLFLDIFVEMYIGQDTTDPTKNRLKLAQTSPSFNGLEIYLRDPVRFKAIVDAQRRYVKGMMKLTGVGNKAGEYTTELMDFMTEIAKIMVTSEERVSENYRIDDMAIKSLQQLTDLHGKRWNWTTYLNGVFEQTNVTVYPENDTTVVFDMDYFKALPILLHKTPVGTIARYVWWEVYASVAPHTKQTFRDLGFEFWKVLYGIKSRTPRWQACTKAVNSYFGMALTSVYVQKHFSVEEKKRALEMWNDVSASFNEMLTELKWMDARTKAQAHRKLIAIRPFIGFPEWVTNPKTLDNHYKEIKVFEGRLWDTYLHYNLIFGRKIRNSWRQKTNRDRWITSGTTVNAFYSPTLNSVTFPAAILHTPLYGNGVEALNYGAIGAIMGHELTHGFDNNGRKYDGNGSIRQWWSNVTLKHYLEKVDCMIKQYTGYEVTQLGENFTLNGINTQGENIADNGGLREAFRAYKKLKSRSKPQRSLPGLAEYTDEQLFFLGFAQMWCGSETDAYLKVRVVKGEHSPDRFRVIGVLQNNADFAKAWKCPHGSAMNPKHKCIVW